MHTPRELAEQHVDIARREARRLRRGDEGLSECYLALVEAACEWDPGADVPFEAWATRLIRLRTGRRLANHRVIAVPWRVRARLAAMLEDLDTQGRAGLDPCREVRDPVLTAALNAVSVQWLHADVDLPAHATDTELAVPDLPAWALVRYGYDGLGMKTAKEVAEAIGASTEEVLALDAQLLRSLGGQAFRGGRSLA
jgi:hypothetical protein